MNRDWIKTDDICIQGLLALPKPSHWPRSSFYCVRSALRLLAAKFPPDQPFPIGALQEILDLLFSECFASSPQPWTLFTYRSRILRFAAEYALGRSLGPWEARWLFERPR
jgi:hypothetical protein